LAVAHLVQICQEDYSIGNATKIDEIMSLDYEQTLLTKVESKQKPKVFSKWLEK
jgi:hypothetical protein